MSYVALTLTDYKSKICSTENYYFINIITSYMDLSSDSSLLTLTAWNFIIFLTIILLTVTLLIQVYSANPIKVYFFFLSGSLFIQFQSSFSWSGETHLILPKSLFKFSLSLWSILFSMFTAHSNAILLMWCLASHLNVFLPCSTSHWYPQSSSITHHSQTPWDLSIWWHAWGTLSWFYHFFLNDCFLSVTLAFLHAPH